MVLIPKAVRVRTSSGWQDVALQGPIGPTGAAGANGASGEKWFTGAGAPSGVAGAVIGDWYLNSTNGDYYEMTGPTTWTLQGNLKGPQGIQGVPGWVWRGSYSAVTAYIVGDVVKQNKAVYVAKLASTGQQPNLSPTYWEVVYDGWIWRGAWSSGGTYVYLDLVERNGSTYIAVVANGPSPPRDPEATTGYWEIVASKGATGPTGSTGSTGSAGAPGSVWRSGTGAPAGGLGIVGDWYLNDANGDVYEKTGASTWTLRDNLTGPTGPSGGTPAAVDVTYAGSAGISAANVEAALDELDTEKAAAASAVMDGDAAGGVLGGTYPNPSFAADMTTQAEFDAAVADIAYQEFTSQTIVSATTAATAHEIVTSGSIVYAAVPIVIEFFAPRISSGVDSTLQLTLWDGSTELGQLGEAAIGGSATGASVGFPCRLTRRFTPTAASHEFRIRAHRSAGSGSPAVTAGAGGAGTKMPGFIRIRRF